MQGQDIREHNASARRYVLRVESCSSAENCFHVISNVPSKVYQTFSRKKAHISFENAITTCSNTENQERMLQRDLTASRLPLSLLFSAISIPFTFSVPVCRYHIQNIFWISLLSLFHDYKLSRLSMRWIIPTHMQESYQITRKLPDIFDYQRWIL